MASLQMRIASLAILLIHLVLLVVNTFSWSEYTQNTNSDTISRVPPPLEQS